MARGTSSTGVCQSEKSIHFYLEVTYGLDLKLNIEKFEVKTTFLEHFPKLPIQIKNSLLIATLNCISRAHLNDLWGIPHSLTGSKHMGPISNIMQSHFLFYSPCAKTPACPHHLPHGKCKYTLRQRSADLISYLWLHPPTHTTRLHHLKSDRQRHCKTKSGRTR